LLHESNSHLRRSEVEEAYQEGVIMFQRYRIACGTIAGLVILGATPVFANHVDTANVTVTCSSYSFSVSASELSPGTKYEIAYQIQTSPAVGPPIVGSIPLKADASQVFDATIWGSFPVLSGSYTFTGTASLVGHNTVSIKFSPTSLTCGEQPPPPKTSGKGIDTESFDGSSVGEGDYVWFNANFRVTGVPKTGGVITFTRSKIMDVDAGTPFSNAVPNAQITFSPTATCTSTTFSTMTNTWLTTVPIKGDDEIFLTGVPVPSAGLRGGTRVSWNGTFDTGGIPGITIDWKWGAAVYTDFASYLNALEVKAAHTTACGQNNADEVATPEGVNNKNQRWKQFAIGGGTGGGGANATGSWGSPNTVTPTSEAVTGAKD
jgi:hypothetical protein